MKPYYPYCIAGLVVITILWLILDLRIKRIHLKASGEAATKALDKISAWTIWLSSLETGAIAAVGFLYSSHCPSPQMLNNAFFTLLFFGMSILLATWLLCSLPSIQMRIEESVSPQNDIYEMHFFQSIPLRFGSFSTLIHTYFVVGLIFFTSFIYSAINSPLLPK